MMTVLDGSAILNIALDNLLSTGNVETTDGSIAGKDGITVADTVLSPTFRKSMVTTAISPGNSNGRRWKGTITFTSALSVAVASLGHDLNSSTGGFNKPFANQTFTAEDVNTDDQMVIEWELFI